MFLLVTVELLNMKRVLLFNILIRKFNFLMKKEFFYGLVVKSFHEDLRSQREPNSCHIYVSYLSVSFATKQFRTLCYFQYTSHLKRTTHSVLKKKSEFTGSS
jgi:hypothetical protein